MAFYFRNVLPRIGTMISGVRGPYEYLPASVHKFPAPQEMMKRMESVGFKDDKLDALHFCDCRLVSWEKAVTNTAH